MLYLFVSVALIIAAAGLYLRAMLSGEPLPRSTQVVLGVFLGVGIVMTYFSVKEIEPYQYERVDKIAVEFPELKGMIEERKPTIQRYEYLEILEAETDAKKALTRG
ncbi:MAG: hypothetical protein R3302_01115 [Sulfurimonadaceae bacterium]|nr:hypothetical protein [Sulfurimonadaceae bacterium]